LSRELNGEVLLDELDELRGGQVSQRQLDECANALRSLKEGSAPRVAASIRELAAHQYADAPSLGSLLRRWATRLKHDVDAPLLVAHFERLAMVSAVVSALQRAAPRGGR
jgi:hypothetical protein